MHGVSRISRRDCSDASQRVRLVREFSLFPLDAGWRLGGNIVEHAVDAFDVVENLVACLTENNGWQLHPICGHGIFGDDSTKVSGPFVAAFVAFDSHGFHRNEACIGLPDFVIPAMFLELADEDRIALADDAEPVFGDDAGAAPGQRSRMLRGLEA